MPVKERKREGLSDSSRESKEGMRKTINLHFELQILPKILNGTYLLVLFLAIYIAKKLVIYHGGWKCRWDRTVVACRQNHLGKLADFPPLLIFFFRF